MLVALGILPDGRKKIIDFQLARAESAAERLLASLYRRGLTGEGMICVDGGNGLLAALPFVYPAVQHCWVHKIRNVLNKVRKTDHKDVKRHLHDVMNASNCGAARTAASPRQDTYPKAVPARRPRRPPRLLLLARRTKAGAYHKRHDASAKSDDEPDLWAPSKTARPWTEYSSPSSRAKTKLREPPPFFRDSYFLTLPPVD